MADEEVNNQRPAIIVAVILATLTAAGLWYFFVFRSSDLPETVQETPVITTETGVDVATSVTPTSTPFPTVPALQGEARSTERPAHVRTTAQTGPAETTAAVALGLTLTGLLGGLLGLRRPRAI